MNRRPLGNGKARPSFGLAALSLLGMLSACQRPTQLLPPAPIFDTQEPALPRSEPPVLEGDQSGGGESDRFTGAKRVYFDRNRADLNEDARRTLDAQAEWLLRHPGVRASLQGHADALGTREHQVALGEKRAVAMKLYLASRGVGVERLSVTSLGKQQLAVGGLDEANQKLNRRGETVLLYVSGTKD